MSRHGRLDAKRFENQHVLERVRQMFLAAQDVRNAEIGIVGAGGHVIGRHTGRAQQREILEVASGLAHRPVDEIRDNNLGP